MPAMWLLAAAAAIAASPSEAPVTSTVTAAPVNATASLAEGDFFAGLSELYPRLYLPKNLEQAGDIADVVSDFAHAHYCHTLALVLALFITLQTCSLPGTIFLNVVMGCTFGYLEGMVVGLLSGTVGAMLCYNLSRRYGRRIALSLVNRLSMNARMAWFKAQVAANDNTDLLLFLLFLRVTPLLPNWFINIVSPHVDVPAGPLAVATLFGIAPQTFIAVHAGTMLRYLIETGHSTPMGAREWMGLLAVGSCLLLPLYAKRKMRTDEAAAAPESGEGGAGTGVRGDAAAVVSPRMRLALERAERLMRNMRASSAVRRRSVEPVRQ